jgi:hypothetical protein
VPIREMSMEPPKPRAIMGLESRRLAVRSGR